MQSKEPSELTHREFASVSHKSVPSTAATKHSSMSVCVCERERKGYGGNREKLTTRYIVKAMPSSTFTCFSILLQFIATPATAHERTLRICTRVVTRRGQTLIKIYIQCNTHKCIVTLMLPLTAAVPSHTNTLSPSGSGQLKSGWTVALLFTTDDGTSE